MNESYTTGTWVVRPGEESAFVEAWTAFASWASTMPGAGPLRLMRDLADAQRFVSIGEWSSLDQVHAWKNDPDFPKLMGPVQRHVAEFRPAELTRVVEVREGAPA